MGISHPITGRRRIKKRVVIADTTVGIPYETLNRSKKYQTPDGSPPRELERPVAVGSNGEITCMNSVTTKKSAKYKTNLTMIDRKTKPSRLLAAESNNPYIALMPSR
jgi:hypothetical protein